MKISVSGDKDVINALKSLGSKVEKKVLRQAMRAGMRPMLAAAKADAPEDTGHLKSSLVIRAAKTKKRGAIALEVRPDEKKYPPGDYYPAQVEYGTSDTLPNPFMADAFASTGETAKSIALGMIAAGIDAIVKQGG
ncbi:HK97-gp10 family putative phage morphogenesis protein [Paludisphaera borealis]|uniref:HK97 gp10 family phage protein n=1 Tax=Paludisphaera borealis TaxID=1387353 RepID=A0A1U7CNK3_9BACT|nr:HK97-gp10 family putative phage morphogenesis protein [Paludisphaera borealis]APW60489.1 hypothetical protein BSF38_01959 [Paludisphaera borealis]